MSRVSHRAENVPEHVPYGDAHTTIAGELTSAGPIVAYRPVATSGEIRVLALISGFIAFSGIGFIAWLAWPSESASTGPVAVVIIGMMIIIESIRLLQSGTLAVFAWKAQEAVPQVAPDGLRVALMTTMVPSKEPWSMVRRTLEGMRTVRYPTGQMDVYLLDEDNDPRIESECQQIGVHHFSRSGIAELNTPSGEFKAKTKAGNHNSWRISHEDGYDIVGQMDPDHVPSERFLERTLGYFNDPDVAYVVAPQVYGNLASSFIAKGAAVLAYVFHGVIQRGGNALGAPLLIGTNHLYRTSAWKQIGGYADFKVEDHATAVIVLATTNPATGNKWKGVYTPDILNVGEGPTTFFDFFQQQKRWALGIWEIIFGLMPKYFRHLTPGQRMAFVMLQSFYPSVAISWVLSNVLTALYLFTAHDSGKPVVVWMLLWSLSIASTLGLFLWLRRFNLVSHERDEWGMAGISLMLLTIPVYVTAMVLTVLRKQTPYGVTAKGRLAKRSNLKTFRAHLAWIVIAGSLLTWSFVTPGSVYPTLRMWLIFTLAVCLAPLLLHYNSLLRSRVGERSEESVIALIPVLAEPDPIKTAE